MNLICKLLRNMKTKKFFRETKREQEIAISNAASIFYITQDEYKKFSDWKKEHNKKCKFSDSMSGGAIGGRFTYIFTPTGVGTATTVKCACGEECDLTDYDMW